ncbi:B12-binding domain-containing radical SAM protein [Candidatus Woesearchaeota archaeon]|nr:B12-binding domain-containing radical SAM protein [Candidatus Woesearchaeota archaeon]
MKALFIEFNIQESVFPLGLMYIKKYLEKHHDDLEIDIKQFSYGKRFSYDINKNLELKVLAYILQEKPDLVAFSSYIWNSEIINNLTRAIKLNSDIKVVVGGVEVNPNNNFYADYIIEGEGELPFKELIDYLKGNLKIEEVSSLIYKKDDNIIKNPKKSIENLDELPFPYLDNENKDYASVRLESSRGCIFNCNYCFYAKVKTREFSLEYMDKGLKYLFENYNFRNLTFLDANFNLKEERMFKLLDMVEENSIKTKKEISLHLEFKPELMNKEMIEKLNKYSFKIFLEMGLQSTDEDVLKDCNRPYNKEKVRENLQLLNKTEIDYKIDLMYGLPGDSFMKFLNSSKFILNNAVKQTNLRAHHFMLLNQTSFYDNKEVKRFNEENSSMVIKTKTQNSLDLYKTKLFIDQINKELKFY